MKDRPVIYWDSCVFLAYIKDEKPPQRDPEDMPGVYASAKEVYERKVELITSTVINFEIVTARLAPNHQRLLDQVFDLSNVHRIELSQRISEDAGRLAEYYRNLKATDGRPGLCRLDAFHLATALAYEVHSFFTFDRRDKNNCRGLLGLNGDVAGRPLRIKRPQSLEGTLSLF